MTAIAFPTRARLDPRASRGAALALVLLVGVLLYLVFRGTATLPGNEDSPVFRTLTEARNTIRDDRPPLLELIGGLKGPVGALANAIIDGLRYVGWLGVVGIATALGWLTGGWRLAALALAGLMSVGALGLWDLSMATLGLTAGAVILSLLLGIPLGILAARSRWVNNVLTPILDVMQIMPAFAYLAPLTLFFGIGVGAAVITTLIYSMPAAIRITALGIRRVPATTVEAASSLGATAWQVLRKVQLPLARRVIALAVNQTIMLALGMVVITVLIDAPGLGVPIYRALSGGRVGAAFEAGIAIVILAIVLDRLTERLSVQPEVTPNAVVDRAAEQRARRVRLGIGLGVAIVAAAVSLQIDAAFPSSIAISLAGGVNDAVNWIKDNLTSATGAIQTGFSVFLLNPFQDVLTSSPWWLVTAVGVALAWIVSGVRPALTAGVAFVLVSLLGLWQDSMTTLASVLVTILASLVIGIVFGILAARSRWFSAVLRPILDFAQTMPSFVYLLPAVALFGPGRFTGIFAALIYAAPPVIRLVEAGLRAVPPTLVEAGTAAGATERQLLTKVRLPASAPALLLAVNQGIIMVLAMVVVAALVGAGALGYDVIAGFAQSEDYGKGLAAAFSIVLLGIMLDRITQGAGTKRPRLRMAAG
jgi:glycine betaine/proline transport system permease protein